MSDRTQAILQANHTRLRPYFDDDRHVDGSHDSNRIGKWAGASARAAWLR